MRPRWIWTGLTAACVLAACGTRSSESTCPPLPDVPRLELGADADTIARTNKPCAAVGNCEYIVIARGATCGEPLATLWATEIKAAKTRSNGRADLVVEHAESWGRRVQTRLAFDGQRYRPVAERRMETRAENRLQLLPRWSQWRAAVSR